MVSHLTHWNLRFPVLLSTRKCIGFLHFGQLGGGGFLGMYASLDLAGAQHSQSPMTADGWAVMD